MMLDNSSYNKTKLLYEFSTLLWFIEKHALNDAQAAGDKQCISLLENIKADLQRNIAHLQKSFCSISQ